MASNEIRLSNYQLASGRFIGCSQIPYASNIHDQDCSGLLIPDTDLGENPRRERGV